MPLRKSPRRTRALLAANRRNSRKSTGPCTAAGKRHSAWNAVRHGRRARASCRCIPLAGRELKAFLDFYCKLDDAIIPAENLVGKQTVMDKALEAWKVKRILDRWIETRTEEDWQRLAARAAPLPSFFRLRLRRPGVSVPDWTVTISIWLRWGRGPGQGGGRSRPSAPLDQDSDNTKTCRPSIHMARACPEPGEGMAMPRAPRMHTPRMHTMVSLHSTGSSRPAEALERELTGPGGERTKPESSTIQSGSENMSIPADWDPAYLEAYALAERFVGWLMGWRKRTKPESNRKKAAYKNMLPADESEGQNPNGSGGATSLGTGFGKVFRAMKAMKTALVPQKEYSQLPLFQTKPECFRKDGTYKNMSKGMSKIGGWLGAAASCLLKRDRQPASLQLRRTA